MPLSPALVNPPAPAAAPMMMSNNPTVPAPYNAHRESSHETNNNNYSRPSGQNVGNFLTDR